MAAHSSTLAWKIPWTTEPGHKEADTTERLHFHFQTPNIHFLLLQSTCLQVERDYCGTWALEPHVKLGSTPNATADN